MRYFLSLLFSFQAFLLLNAQVDADFASSQFYAPGQSPYVEAYIKIDAASLEYTQTEKGTYQGRLEITYAFFDENDEVSSFDKFELLSPAFPHPDSISGSFLDKKVLAVDNGDYELEISIRDLNKETQIAGRARQIISINFDEDTASISDLVFVANHNSNPQEGSVWAKNGVDIIPYVFDYFPDHLKTLSFYAEFYNTHKITGNAPFVARYAVTNNRGKLIPYLTAYKRCKPGSIQALFKSFDISDLPSGNYYLSVDLLDSNQNVFASKSVNFTQINRQAIAQESNSSTHYNRFSKYVESIPFDSLSEYVKAMAPMAPSEDQTWINSNHKMLPEGELQNLFVDYWLKENPSDPAEAWFAYKKKVDMVNNSFTTRQIKGYESDRGYIYLRYGEPNTIVQRENEPSNYPYHIWHYYDHPRRSDARYIFYNPELATNEYRLLHSNVIGEVNNARWKQELSRRNTPFRDVDFEGEGGNYGDWSDEFFMQPR